MKTKRKIFIAFILNLIFSVFEVIGGIFTGSVAITSDAIHDFGDAISIGTSYFLEKTSCKKPNNKYTYGYLRFSVLGGFLTTAILLISSTITIYNAILRFTEPKPINYNAMIIFAVVGFLINLIATYFTHGGKSINQKAVNLHMLEDVLGWLIVLIGAIVIRFTNLYIIDPILSIIVSIFILINCYKNLKLILDIFLIKTPKNVDIDNLIDNIKKFEKVVDVHSLHILSVDGEINCLTLHLVVSELDSTIKTKVKEEIKKHQISHITIEMETDLEDCEEKSFSLKKQVHHCTHSHCHH